MERPEPIEEDELLEPWDRRILRRIDSGVDVTQIEENLRRSPTERLERMEAMLRAVKEMRDDARDSRAAAR
jgi:hypothetical protein